MERDSLSELECLAREAGAEGIAMEARSLAERATEGRFYVACVGQFKRGKSTLLNALVGAEILPTGIAPVTSVPTILRYGNLAARVRSDGGWKEIEPCHLIEFVSEECNPGNAKGVLAVEAFVPCPLLASGLCLVDTPGLGSVFEANTAATREFVPHIDAALVVLGADPPLAGEELQLIQEIAREVQDLIFVLNKADRFSDSEMDEASVFTERIISERIEQPVDRLFRVSALERLSVGKAARDWEEFEARLRRLAEDSGRALVAASIDRGIRRLGARLDHILHEETDALQRPLEESQQRLGRLRLALEQAEQAIRTLGPLFAAEELAITQKFTARRTAFLKEVLPQSDSKLEAQISELQKHRRQEWRECAFQLAQRIARERIEPWLSESEQIAGEEFHQVQERFIQIANELLSRLRESNEPAMPALPVEIADEDGLKTKRGFTFYEFLHLTSPAGLVPALQGLCDVVLPATLVQRNIGHHACEFMHRLLETNASRVENDLKERLHESRVCIEGAIRSTLKEALGIAESAAEQARLIQAAGDAAIQEHVHRLGRLRQRLDTLLTSSNL